MKIDKVKLSKALNKIGIFVGKNNISPKTFLVHFKNINNKAVVFASDLNSAGRAYFDTDEADDLEFCIEYEQLMQAIKIRSKEISVEFVENQEGNRKIKFYDNRTYFSWPTRENDSLAEIESISIVPNEPHFQILGKELKKAIAEGGYAREDKDNQYPFVTGVHFVSKGDSVDIHSTDRKRIAGWKSRATQEIEGMEGNIMDGILSPQNIKSVVLFDDDEQISLYITDSQIILVSSNLEAYASKINCEYKDISPFFEKPISCSYSVKVNDVLESIGIIDSKDCNWISLEFKEPEVLVEASYKEGNIHDSFECKKISGENAKGYFEIKKLKDIFSNVKSEEIILEFRELNERITVLTYHTEEGGYGMLGQYKIG